VSDNPPTYTGIDPGESMSVLGPIVTVDQAGAWMQLPNPEDDDLLEQAVIAGNAAFASWLGWDPRAMRTVELVDVTGGKSVRVHRKKITAVNALTFMPPGCAPVPLNLNFVSWDPRVPLITNACGMPRSRNSLQCDYQAGYDTLPNDLIQCFLWTIKAHYDASGVDQNATGESFSGVLSQTFHAAGAGFVPPAAMSSGARYRLEY
jgi:hypothetical protein